MALGNKPQPGFHNLPSYQVSGIPFLETITLSSGDSAYVSFPFVTNFVHFSTNSSSSDRKVKIGFSPNSIANNRYFTTNRQIRNSDNIVDPAFNYRCNELYLKYDGAGSVKISIFAGLTTIPSGSFPADYEASVYSL